MFNYELEKLQIISNCIKNKNYDINDLIQAMIYVNGIVSKLIVAKLDLKKEGEDIKEVIRD